MSLKDLIGEYGLVIKVDVSDLEKSTQWYTEKLHFQLDERYNADTWRQLNIPDVTNTAIGLHLNPEGAGMEGKKATFVVNDINAARNELVKNNVEVDEIITLGEWVKLAFFRDPDGNILGLRQNHASHPNAGEIGAK
ncbi:MAG: VOC family protein [Pseudomonadales bacterium]|nr:VOC family protein [Pseudomonadales bacterium]